MLTKEETINRKELAGSLLPDISLQLQNLNGTVFFGVKEDKVDLVAERLSLLMAYFNDVAAEDIREMNFLSFASVMEFTVYRIQQELSDGDILNLLEFIGKPLPKDKYTAWFLYGKGKPIDVENFMSGFLAGE